MASFVVMVLIGIGSVEGFVGVVLYQNGFGMISQT